MFGIDDVFGAGLKIISQIIDRVSPDPNQAAQMKLEMLKLQQEGAFKELEADLQLSLAQVATNTEEAKSANWFVSGWRPFVGWVCGAAFAYNFVIQPFLIFILKACGKDVVTPGLDMAALGTVLTGMLGLGGFRTMEKFKGVAR